MNIDCDRDLQHNSVGFCNGTKQYLEQCCHINNIPRSPLMVTSWHGISYCIHGPSCGEQVINGFPIQRASNAEFWFFLIISHIKPLNNHSIGQRDKTPLCLLIFAGFFRIRQALLTCGISRSYLRHDLRLAHVTSLKCDKRATVLIPWWQQWPVRLTFQAGLRGLNYLWSTVIELRF